MTTLTSKKYDASLHTVLSSPLAGVRKEAGLDTPRFETIPRKRNSSKVLVTEKGSSEVPVKTLPMANDGW